MRLQVHSVCDSDLPKLIEIEFAAFHPNAPARALHGRDMRNASHLIRAFRRYDEILSDRPYTFFRKVVDADVPDTPANLPYEYTQGRQERIGYAAHEGSIVGWLQYERCQAGVERKKPVGYRLAEGGLWVMEEEDEWDCVREYWEKCEAERRRIMGSRPHNCE